MTRPLSDLRDAGPAARAAALAANAAVADATSPLDTAGLDALLACAACAPATADGRAFAIALPETAAHDGPNFRWLQARVARFLYVDRVVVDAGLRRTGAGRALYGAVIAAADATGRPVVAEVNRVPPNPGSDAFHAAMGFAEIGRGTPAPGKVVRYLRRDPGHPG